MGRLCGDGSEFLIMLCYTSVPGPRRDIWKATHTTELLMSQQKLPEASGAVLGLGVVQDPCQVVCKEEEDVLPS